MTTVHHLSEPIMLLIPPPLWRRLPLTRRIARRARGFFPVQPKSTRRKILLPGTFIVYCQIGVNAISIIINSLLVRRLYSKRRKKRIDIVLTAQSPHGRQQGAAQPQQSAADDDDPGGGFCFNQQRKRQNKHDHHRYQHQLKKGRLLRMVRHKAIVALT